MGALLVGTSDARAQTSTTTTTAAAAIAATAPSNPRAPSIVADDKQGDVKATRPGLLDQPHTVAEFEAGFLALPTAPISPSQRGGDTPVGRLGKGDATVLTGLHLLYRGSPEWAIGAGFLFAPQPTSDEGEAGASNLPRSHSRSYLEVGAEARYFPFRYSIAEAWVGLAGSAVVIADRYTWESAPTLPAILGSKSVTISTEGAAIAIQAGGNWMFAERWVAGLTLRASRWILPQTPKCLPVGDCATLSGTVEAFEAGLTLGYRIPL